jgi:predicted transglutaminase-like cysteine proteinase
MKELVLSAALLMFISSLASVSSGHAVHLGPQLTPQKAVFMGSFGNSLPPIGYVAFCRDHQAECRPSGPIVDREPLTPERRAELEQVNRFVNQTIKPVTDLELYGKVEYWTYPTQGKGD